MNSSPPPTVSVIVLSYNGGEFISECLCRLAASEGVSFEVICFDNASTDESLAAFARDELPRLILRSPVNLGFAGGNNAAARFASGEILLFLNPDCWVDPPTLALLAASLQQQEKRAIAGAVLRYPDGMLQHAGGRILPNAATEHFREMPEKPITPVDYATGACFAIRRRDFDAVGGFDEDFHPAYYEEADLCFRFRRAGREVVVVRDATAIHHESPGLTIHSDRFDRMLSEARMRYWVKNFGPRYLLFRGIPFEHRWYRSLPSPGLKAAIRHSYGSGIKFALKCFKRRSRRSTRGLHPVDSFERLR